MKIPNFASKCSHTTDREFNREFTHVYNSFQQKKFVRVRVAFSQLNWPALFLGR